MAREETQVAQFRARPWPVVCGSERDLAPYGEPCPVLLVDETGFEADGVTPKENNTQQRLTSDTFVFFAGSDDKPPSPPSACHISWHIMDQTFGSFHVQPPITKPMPLDTALRTAMGLSKLPGCGGLWDPLRKHFKSLCGPRNSESRGRPQPVPRRVGRLETAFGAGKWYAATVKGHGANGNPGYGRYVVVQVLSRESPRPNRARTRLVLRVLVKRKTEACRTHDRLLRDYRNTQSPDAFFAWLRENVHEPLELTHTSHTFEKDVDPPRPRRRRCGCCRSKDPHESMVIAGQTVCARAGVERGPLCVEW